MFRDVLQNRCSGNYCKFHWKMPVLESLLNKVVALNACRFLKKWLQHRSFPVKLVKILRAPFFTEHHRWLLLNTPNHILQFNKKNKVNYVKLNEHPKAFIMGIMLLKDLILRFYNTKIEQKVLYFSELCSICILNY